MLHDGEKYEANKIHGLSEVGRPLLVRYDLEKLKTKLVEMTLRIPKQMDFGVILLFCQSKIQIIECLLEKSSHH
jgi:hypothetical protein